MLDHLFNFNTIDQSWQACLQRAVAKVDDNYLQSLAQSSDWLPGHKQIFNAFRQPINNINYVLFGESPYPRRESANGYAFWDAAVHELWSPTGLNKKVNRATSLRNLIKMLLVASGRLDPMHTSQTDIANIDKANLIQTNDKLFENFIEHGFLLLNATPVLQPRKVSTPKKDARAWYPFTQELLRCLLETRPQVEFILLGNIANTIDALITKPGINKLYAEHPYNHSFITNKKVLNFFRPFGLLEKP